MPQQPPAQPADEQLLLRVQVEGQQYEIDINHLTLQEECDTEEYFNKPFPVIASGGWILSTKGMVWFAYLARKRKDPTYTLAQALAVAAEQFEVKQLGPSDEEGGEAEERPTEGRKTSGRRRSQS